MTPAARLSAAIEVLDRILDGQPAEPALTAWGRANRFAGSGDRHALRDLVFEALRRKRSAAALGGGLTGRGLVLGLLRQRGEDPAALFTGQAHAPAPVAGDEAGRAPLPLEALDCPDWLAPRLERALGDGFAATMAALQDRAPLWLRVNLRRATPEAARAALGADGIEVRGDPALPAALEVLTNARKINGSAAYLQGMVELQDRASQEVVLGLGLSKGQSALDYCAGSGGKTLALASQTGARFFAHDQDPRRMQDLPERARRAGVDVRLLSDPAQGAPYDLVLCDTPCSGSGSWRRDPQGKWALSPRRLDELCNIQAEILDRAAKLVQPEGELVYVTCSLLREENEEQVESFLRRSPQWGCLDQRRLALGAPGDGFFRARLRRSGGRGLNLG
ncbi:MAG: RsmB/NOP family class I SAM-dependent RNA methyltransferase [Paracoccaceae bacterium]